MLNLSLSRKVAGARVKRVYRQHQSVARQRDFISMKAWRRDCPAATATSASGIRIVVFRLRHQTFAIANRQNEFEHAGSERAAVLPREKGVASRRRRSAGHRSAAWTASRDKKGRLQQLVIIQGTNLGVAQLGEPRRHRAVKLLQRSACTAPPLGWNQGGPCVSDCALHSCRKR